MDLSEAIRKRTMVREYSAKPLTQEERERILAAAIRAPTASGSEQWCFVVVDSEEKRDELYRLLIEAQEVYFSKMLRKPWSEERIQRWTTAARGGAYKAPLYVAVLVDLRERYCTIPEIEELWAQQSVAAAIENMLLEAWGMGIGGCWYGVPLLMGKAFDALLGSDPKRLKLAAVLGLGHPREEEQPRQRHKPLDKITRTI